MNLFEKVMIKIIQLLSSIFISIFIVLISLWNPVTINNSAELKHVELGLPFSFFEQDLSRLNPNLPVELGIHSPLEYPFEVFWPSLFFSILITSLLVLVLPFMIKKLKPIVNAHIIEKLKNHSALENDTSEENTNTVEKIRERGLM